MKLSSWLKAAARLSCMALAGIGMTSCREAYTPKPRAYIRITVPEKAYRDFDSAAYPFTFRIPVYARFEPVPVDDQYPNSQWADIRIPELNAKIYLSYIPDPNIDSCLVGTLLFIQRHMSKATGVDEWEIHQPEERKFGYLYHIKGKDVASPYQFYLTDSNRHFVRGAFYINSVPNNDSLAPVIDFIKTDIDTLIQSWKWD